MSRAEVWRHQDTTLAQHKFCLTRYGFTNQIEMVFAQASLVQLNCMQDFSRCSAKSPFKACSFKFNQNPSAMTILKPSTIHALCAARTSLKPTKENLSRNKIFHSYFRNARRLWIQSTHQRNQNPVSEKTEEQQQDEVVKRSLASATGEFFLGLVALLRRSSPATKNSRRTWFSGIFPVNTQVEEAEAAEIEQKVENEDDVASVTKDEIDPAVVWEQRREDVEAEKQRRVITSPGFSFSAAGFLLPYHLGAAQCLMDKGYIRENTPLAGSSGGAIASAIIASGIDLKASLDIAKELADDCRRNGTVFRVGALLKQYLEKSLPGDIHIRANGKIRVAITQVFRAPRALLVDHFDSKEDLINAVFTSSFVPGYLAPRPATLFRNRLCVDGGLTLFMPPTVADKTVRICVFPLSRLGLQGIGISPDCNPERKVSPRKLLNWALEPADDGVLDELFENGYQDATVWTIQNPKEEIVKPDIAIDVL